MYLAGRKPTTSLNTISLGRFNMAKNINPRWKSGKRRLYQQRFKALQLPCAICGRKIDYSLPYYFTDEAGRKHVNMWAFVIDEKIPISKWKEAGYSSPAEASNTWENLQPAHAICNAKKGNKINFSLKDTCNMQAQARGQRQTKKKNIALDGEW